MSRDRAQNYVFIGPVTVHNSIDEADNTEEETANGGQETNQPGHLIKQSETWRENQLVPEQFGKQPGHDQDLIRDLC